MWECFDSLMPTSDSPQFAQTRIYSLFSSDYGVLAAAMFSHPLSYIDALLTQPVVYGLHFTLNQTS